MKKNTLFRGCTRPPMFMGVPYVPFFIGAGIPLLFAMYFNLFYLCCFCLSEFIRKNRTYNYKFTKIFFILRNSKIYKNSIKIPKKLYFLKF